MVFKLYNGWPNDELQAHWDSQDEARASLPKGWSCTYFPVEGKYMVFDERHRPVTNEFCGSVEYACAQALAIKEDPALLSWAKGYDRGINGGDVWENPYFEKGDPINWFNYRAGWETGSAKYEIKNATPT